MVIFLLAGFIFLSSLSCWLVYLSYWLAYLSCWLAYLSCWLAYLSCWLDYLSCWLAYLSCWLAYLSCWLDYLSCWLDYLSCWLAYLSCWLAYLSCWLAYLSCWQQASLTVHLYLYLKVCLPNYPQLAAGQPKFQLVCLLPSLLTFPKGCQPVRHTGNGSDFRLPCCCSAYRPHRSKSDCLPICLLPSLSTNMESKSDHHPVSCKISVPFSSLPIANLACYPCCWPDYCCQVCPPRIRQPVRTPCKLAPSLLESVCCPKVWLAGWQQGSGNTRLSWKSNGFL